MSKAIIIAIVSLVLHAAIYAAGQERYNYANEDNAYYGCIDCHNKGTFRKTWSHLGSQRLHESHEAKGTECQFCHHKPNEEVTLK